MKAPLFTLLSLAVCAVVLRAQPASGLADSPPGAFPVVPRIAREQEAWTVTAPLVSQYLFRGVRYGGLSFQPSLEYTNRRVTVGVWSNVPVQDEVPGQSDPEIDFHGSYGFTLPGGVELRPGFTLYTFPDAVKADGFYRRTFEPNLAFNVTVRGVRFTPKVYYDVHLDGPTYELNAAYSVPLASFGTELAFNATVGTFLWRDAWERTEPAVKNWGDYWLAGVTLPYQISFQSRVAVGLAYSKGTGNYLKHGSAPKYVNPAAVGRGIVTVSYSRTF